MTLIHSTDEQKARSLELKILSCDTRAALIELCAYQPFSLTQKGHIVFVTRSKNIFNQDRFTIESFNSNVSPNKHTAQMHWFNRQLKLALKTYGLNAPLAFGLDLEVNPEPYPYSHAFFLPFDTGGPRGGILHTRDEPWTANAQNLALRLTALYANRWADLA